jgi:signal transduction histidine kinase
MADSGGVDNDVGLSRDSGTPRRVLVAEDDVVNAAILRDILASAGHQITWARDGEQALALIAAESPDLVVLDLMMPKVDGLGVCARLKGNLSTRHIPILVITAISDQASRFRAIEVGADDYVVKPVDRIEVITRARALLRTKALYDEVQAQLKSVQRLEEMKRQLVQFLVHDLQNPLTAVMANIEIAQHEDLRGNAESLGASLADAYQGARRMYELLQSLLDIEKMEEGQFQVRLEPVDITQVANDVAGVLRGSATQNNAALSVEAPASVIATADEGLLRRILSNLVGNAIRFAPENTAVLVRVTSQDGRAIVTVSDNGPGIPRAIRSQIFEKFRQAGSRVQRGGAGLGLTFCKMAIEALGGQIWIEEEREGKSGATFVVTVPLRANR